MIIVPLLVIASLLLQAPSAQPQRITSRAELVVVHVTVANHKSGYVSGLAREAFTVYEDGVAQPVTFFDHANLPVTVGLVLDSSISMSRRRDAILAGGTTFVQSSQPDDELFTIHFNERVWPGLPADRPFTSDREVLRQSLMQMRLRGQTALFDAVRSSLKQLEQGHCQKKVLVVISDGGDNASHTRFEDVLALALRMDAVIYTVSIKDQYDGDARPEVLRKLAAVTGGEAFFVRNISEVTATFERIARDIRSGYIIGYVPPAAAAGYRAIRVDVQAPGRQKLMVRARPGYQR
jgi:Ca-activated chloride channel homolog